MQGQLVEALKVHNKALRYRRRTLGNGHEDVAESIRHVALIHMMQEQFHEALVLLKEAHRIVRGAFGNDHVSVAGTCFSMAQCKLQLGDLAGALAGFRKSHRIFSQHGAVHAEDAQKAAEFVQRLEA